jgi:imidazoleglycerol-phosphate dehydratase
MRIAFVIYPGMTALDFVGVYDPLTRLKTMGLREDIAWEVCALTQEVNEIAGLTLLPSLVGTPLTGFDLLVVPGGFAARELAEDQPFIAWLRTALDTPLVASVCTGSLLLGAAGFLEDKPATTHPTAMEQLAHYTSDVRRERIVDAGQVITAGGVSASLDLGLYLVRKLAGEETAEQIRRQMDYPLPIPTGLPARQAEVRRATRETRLVVRLDLDGRGVHNLHTGLPFLDHMLAQLALHGLFDLDIEALGDLDVDEHHTLEDTALALGTAFSQALSDRQGITRAGWSLSPMDESLAEVSLDFSGRPFARLSGSPWHTPATGKIANTLWAHFLESFARTAGCAIHADIRSGSDDHHQVEALFKAFGRALCAATRLDPRRAGQVPSTKGSL